MRSGCHLASVHTHTHTHTLTHTQDGRLQQGDHLLQINEESVIHMKYDDVVAQLRSVSQAGKAIRLVVARPVEGESAGAVPELNDVSTCMQGGIVRILFTTVLKASASHSQYSTHNTTNVTHNSTHVTHNVMHATHNAVLTICHSQQYTCYSQCNACHSQCSITIQPMSLTTVHMLLTTQHLSLTM